MAFSHIGTFLPLTHVHTHADSACVLKIRPMNKNVIKIEISFIFSLLYFFHLLNPNTHTNSVPSKRSEAGSGTAAGRTAQA